MIKRAKNLTNKITAPVLLLIVMALVVAGVTATMSLSERYRVKFADATPSPQSEVVSKTTNNKVTNESTPTQPAAAAKKAKEGSIKVGIQALSQDEEIQNPVLDPANELWANDAAVEETDNAAFMPVVQFTDFEKALVAPKIEINLLNTHIDPASLKWDKSKVGVQGSLVKSVAVLDKEDENKVKTQKLIIQLADIQGSAEVALPISFEFDKKQTPNNFETFLSAQVYDAQDTLLANSQDSKDAAFNPESWLMYTYEYPTLRVVVNGNPDNNLINAGKTQKNSKGIEAVVADTAKPVSYSFEFGNLKENNWTIANPAFKRHMEEIRVLFTLPTYTSQDGKVITAKFDQSLNPGWVLQDDQHAVYTLSASQLTVDENAAQAIEIPALNLQFPHAVINGSSIASAVEITCVPTQVINPANGQRQVDSWFNKNKEAFVEDPVVLSADNSIQLDSDLVEEPQVTQDKGLIETVKDIFKGKPATTAQNGNNEITASKEQAKQEVAPEKKPGFLARLFGGLTRGNQTYTLQVKVESADRDDSNNLITNPIEGATFKLYQRNDKPVISGEVAENHLDEYYTYLEEATSNQSGIVQFAGSYSANDYIAVQSSSVDPYENMGDFRKFTKEELEGSAASGNPSVYLHPDTVFNTKSWKIDLLFTYNTKNFETLEETPIEDAAFTYWITKNKNDAQAGIYLTKGIVTTDENGIARIANLDKEYANYYIILANLEYLGNLPNISYPYDIDFVIGEPIRIGDILENAKYKGTDQKAEQPFTKNVEAVVYPAIDIDSASINEIVLTNVDQHGSPVKNSVFKIEKYIGNLSDAELENNQAELKSQDSSIWGIATDPINNKVYDKEYVTEDNGKFAASEWYYFSRGTYRITQLIPGEGCLEPENPYTLVTKSDFDEAGRLNVKKEIISNRDNFTYTVKAYKKDAVTGEPIANAEYHLKKYTGLVNNSSLNMTEDYWESIKEYDFEKSFYSSSAGEIVFDGLTLNSYFLKEYRPQKGYMLSPEGSMIVTREELLMAREAALSENPQATSATIIKNDGLVNTRIGNEGDTYNLNIVKKDFNTGKLLSGAKFRLDRYVGSFPEDEVPFDEDVQLSSWYQGKGNWEIVKDVGTTGEDGQVLSEDLPVGIYRLVETAPPAGYPDTLGVTPITSADFINAEVDSNNPTIKVINKTITNRNDYTFSFEFESVEITEEDNQGNPTQYKAVPGREFKLYKLNEPANPDEPQVDFDEAVQDISKYFTVVETAVSDENGKVLFDNGGKHYPLGDYFVRGSNELEEYYPLYMPTYIERPDLDYEAGRNPNEIHHKMVLPLENNKPRIYFDVKLVKYADYHGEKVVLPGAKFNLKVKQQIPDLNKAYDFKELYVDMGEQVSDENGILVWKHILFDPDVNFGELNLIKLTEIEAPAGYEKLAEPIEPEKVYLQSYWFKYISDEDNPTQIQTSSSGIQTRAFGNKIDENYMLSHWIENRAYKYGIELDKTADFKKDSDGLIVEGGPLSGAEFKITKFKNSNPEGTDPDVNNEEQWEEVPGVGPVVSDENGKVKFLDLLYGTYRITETKAPEGYQIADQKHTLVTGEQLETGDLIIDVNNPDNDYTLYKVANPIENKLERYEINLSKVDQFDNPVAGAEFRIERMLPSIESSFQENNPIQRRYYISDDESWTDVDDPNVGLAKIKSDENGLVKWSNLPAGHYRITETKAPEGYEKLNPSVFLVTKSDLKGSGATAKYSLGKVVNKKNTTFMVHLNKYKNSRVEPVQAQEVPEGMPLQGATFTIQRLSPDYVPTGILELANVEDEFWLSVDGQADLTTNEDGFVEFKNLPADNYRIIESGVPEGYVAEKPIYIEKSALENLAIGVSDDENQNIPYKVKRYNPYLGKDEAIDPVVVNAEKPTYGLEFYKTIMTDDGFVPFKGAELTLYWSKEGVTDAPDYQDPDSPEFLEKWEIVPDTYGTNPQITSDENKCLVKWEGFKIDLTREFDENSGFFDRDFLLVETNVDYSVAGGEEGDYYFLTQPVTRTYLHQSRNNEKFWGEDKLDNPYGADDWDPFYNISDPKSYLKYVGSLTYTNYDPKAEPPNPTYNDRQFVASDNRIHKAFYFKLNKFGEDGMPLSGAQFKLERMKPEEQIKAEDPDLWEKYFNSGKNIDASSTLEDGLWDVSQSNMPLSVRDIRTTSGDGYIGWTGIPVGYYRIVEVKAPEGYRPIAQPLFIDKQYLLDLYAQYQNGYRAAPPTEVFYGEMWVTNMKEPILPKTGGPGQSVFYFLGTFMSLSALGFAIYSNRRKSFT